ncbi:MAG: DUF4097 family beta strand repeat protein, partial [Clostridia bacterium]|nr:DUF4097 family beta strand repeat protein [Clostridia bacterium]
NGKLILYMPALTFDDVTIKTGAGKVEIESITAKTLSFTFGAGEVAIGQLSVSVNANIETGAGKFTVVSGLVSNLDLDLGVGETLLKCDLLGESELNCGVGQVSLTLSKKEDYTLKLDKGIGTIKVDGVSLSGGTVVGQGTNIVEIDGGIGEIAVTFTE